MAGYHLCALGRDAQELACTLRDIAVGGTVETVATDAVLLIQLVGDGIHIGLGGHRLMESGVEHAYLRQARHQLLHSVHTLEVGRIMQRSQVGAFLKLLQHLVGEDD